MAFFTKPVDVQMCEDPIRFDRVIFDIHVLDTGAVASLTAHFEVRVP
jgi:hypothetical protein